jgi:uncharacterized protein YqgV (UPF0045/DUF77 family)
MKASGLSYSMHSAGTTVGKAHPLLIYLFRKIIWLKRIMDYSLLTLVDVGKLVEPSRSRVGVLNQYLLPLNPNFNTEGSWDEVMRLIGQAHTLVHQNGVLRVQTDIRAGTR